MKQETTQPTQPKDSHFSDDYVSFTNRALNGLESASDTFQYFLLLAGAIETFIIMTYLGIPVYLALLFPFGIEGAGLNAKLKLQNGKYVTDEQQRIGKYITRISMSMSALAIFMIIAWDSLPHVAQISGGVIFAMSPFALTMMTNHAKNLDPSHQSKVKRQAAKYEVEAIELENKRSLAVIQTETHYGNLIAEEEQRAMIAQTDNNIIINSLAVKLAESRVHLEQSKRMEADAMKLLESKSKKGLALKEKSMNAMLKQTETYMSSDDAINEMMNRSRAVFLATMDDVTQALLPAYVEAPNSPTQAINTPSTAQQLPAQSAPIINNRKATGSRVCANSGCNESLVGKHKSTKYCGNTCKSQANKASKT